MDSDLLVHQKRSQVSGQGGVFHRHFSFRDPVRAVCEGRDVARCVGGHPFLHIPTVGPTPQYQGTLALASSRHILSSLSMGHGEERKL